MTSLWTPALVPLQVGSSSSGRQARSERAGFDKPTVSLARLTLGSERVLGRQAKRVTSKLFRHPVRMRVDV